MKLAKSLILIIAFFPISSCFGLFDSGEPWKDEPYILLWIDVSDAVTLNYKLSDTASIIRISDVVYSVGSNKDFIVAKQHPGGDKNITNYYIVDRDKDGELANISDVVTGPLHKREFQEHALTLSLPEFTFTLKSLE